MTKAIDIERQLIERFLPSSAPGSPPIKWAAPLFTVAPDTPNAPERHKRPQGDINPP